MRVSRLAAGAVAVLFVAGLAAGCGSDDGVSSEDRAEVIEDLMAFEGLDRDEAECVVDRLIDKVGGERFTQLVAAEPADFEDMDLEEMARLDAMADEAYEECDVEPQFGPGDMDIDDLDIDGLDLGDLDVPDFDDITVPQN